jgi:hypothetical protein
LGTADFDDPDGADEMTGQPLAGRVLGGGAAELRLAAGPKPSVEIMMLSIASSWLLISILGS